MLDLDVELVYTVLVPTRETKQRKARNEKKNKKSSKKCLTWFQNSDIMWVHK
jgi:hypothetical protein